MVYRYACPGLVGIALSIALGCVPPIDIDVVDGSMDARADTASRDTSISRDAARDAPQDTFQDSAPDSGGRLDAPLDSGSDAFDSSTDVLETEDTAVCTPSCTIGGACGADDGCGGKCIGVCPDPENEVCYGGICSSASWCLSGACDPFSGTGCVVGEACRAETSTEVASCGDAGVGLDGDACSAHEDCAGGFGCRLGKCRRYCCHAGMLFGDSSDHCPGYCERVGARLGFCVQTCNPRNPSSCDPDQVCVWSFERAGLTYCIESVAPDASVGDPCTFANQCAHGQFCFENICRLACDPADDMCPAPETCTVVHPTPSISVCLPS